MKQIRTIIAFIVLTAAISLVGLQPAQAKEREAESAADLAAVTEQKKDTRALFLRAFLKSYDSPMAGVSEAFVAEADKHGLDWKLVAAIAGTESTFGKHVPAGSYNAWGWGIPTGAQSGIAFETWEDGIATVSEGLKTRYIDRGAETIETIGRIYAASPRWAGNVRFFLAKMEAFIPTDSETLLVTL